MVRGPPSTRRKPSRLLRDLVASGEGTAERECNASVAATGAIALERAHRGTTLGALPMGPKYGTLEQVVVSRDCWVAKQLRRTVGR